MDALLHKLYETDSHSFINICLDAKDCGDLAKMLLYIFLKGFEVREDIEYISARMKLCGVRVIANELTSIKDLVAKDDNPDDVANYKFLVKNFKGHDYVVSFEPSHPQPVGCAKDFAKHAGL